MIPTLKLIFVMGFQTMFQVLKIVEFIFQNNVDEAISNLNSVIGWDNIYSYHLKYAGDPFRSLIARLFDSFLRHNYLSEAMLNGKIEPFLKDNKISKALSSN